MKQRIFLAVKEPMEGEAGVVCAIDEAARHTFSETLDVFTSEQFDFDGPTAPLFARFARFCREECGCKDPNDEVIFARDSHPLGPYTLAEDIALRLAGAQWAVVEFIEFNYCYETVHLLAPMPFPAFEKRYRVGEEPQATRRLYAAYRKKIHKDRYTPSELDRMEAYIFAHLDEVYRRTKRPIARFDEVTRIACTCAAIYRCDRPRLEGILEKIVADYLRRRSSRRKDGLMELLLDIADTTFCDGEIDYVRLEADEKKPPIERECYAVFANLSPAARKVIVPLIDAYEKEP